MATHPLMHWLAGGLPITLLCDLVDPDGPDSAAVNAAERPPADPIWHDAATRHGRLVRRWRRYSDVSV